MSIQLIGTGPITVDIQKFQLLWATESNDVDLVEQLLQDSNTDVNITTRCGCTSLIEASQYGYGRIVKLLVKHPKTDVNKADNGGHTPLLVASGNGLTIIVELLLQQPEIKVTKVDWPNLKVRMLYLLFDKLLEKTSEEVKHLTKIRAHYTKLQHSINSSTQLYNDLAHIIYKFARPTYVQIMESMDFEKCDI